MKGMIFCIATAYHIYSEKSDIESLCFCNFNKSEDKGISIFRQSVIVQIMS